ncbi:hypothetical protein BDF14DRAFT_810280 [Spinellus fusiger]|nr:hypothetical protein BDF14DRAFT_810280 [Spinellus fusiger]
MPYFWGKEEVVLRARALPPPNQEEVETGSGRNTPEEQPVSREEPEAQDQNEEAAGGLSEENDLDAIHMPDEPVPEEVAVPEEEPVLEEEVAMSGSEFPSEVEELIRYGQKRKATVRWKKMHQQEMECLLEGHPIVDDAPGSTRRCRLIEEDSNFEDSEPEESKPEEDL